MPFARIDAASSSSRSAWKIVLGCKGFAWIASIGRREGAESRAADGAAADSIRLGRAGSSVERPLPSTLRDLSLTLFICKDFLGEFNIALCTARTRVVHQDWLPITGGLREANGSGDHCIQNIISEKVF